MGFTRQDTGVGCHFLLQGISTTQWLNPHLLHWQEDSLSLRHQESPFHMLARLCSESFKVGFRNMWAKNFQIYKLGFKGTEEPGIKLATFAGSRRKQGSSRKTSTSVSLTMLKPLTVWTTTNCGKFLKRWEYQTSLPVSWETCMWVKKQLENRTRDNRLVQNWKGVRQAVYWHPACLTSKKSTSCKMPGWVNQKLESKLPGEISTTSDMQMIPLLAESEEELKSLLMKVKEETEKAGLKLNSQIYKEIAFVHRPQ